MKLRVEREQFASGITWVTRTVAARAHLPALSGVLLEAADGALTARTTDQEMSSVIAIPAQVDEPGTALLPGRYLAQLVGRLPDAPVALSQAGDAVEIQVGRATFQFRSMSASDFPVIAPVADDAAGAPIASDALTRLVGQVARAASTDEARPVLTGVQLAVADGVLTAAATDSYRLAMRRLPWAGGFEGEALVPARALQEAARFGGETDAEIQIALEEGRVSFSSPDRTLSSLLIDGQFPNVRKLLPDSVETSVTIERAPLVEALQRLAIVGQGSTNTPLSLQFSDGSCELQISNQEIGSGAEALPATIDGDDLTIAFNPTYLLQGLEATGSTRVTFELTDGLKPAVVRPTPEDGEQAEDFTYLLMPMRVS
ncbi:MAG: DNA polymerase III subunit beta [Nitriliruptorales bacterium]|nr:DNA polymerase III subunit beta [Nitriliruptorales bacterium]